MKVRHTLICFFFLSLQDGNSGLANAQLSVFTRTEGGDVRVKCSISSSGSRMFFCRGGCQRQDILVETTGVRAQRGRYSIEYINLPSTGGSLYVSITQLTKSDSGRYRCGLGTSYYEFRVSVVDALLDGNPSEGKPLYTRTGGNITVECSFTFSAVRKYFCKEECEEKDILVETTGYTAESGRYSIEYIRGSFTGGSLYVSITQLTKSDSGRYRCGMESRLLQDPYRVFEIIVTDALLDGNPSEGKPLYTRTGGNITVECSFTFSAVRKYFCKEECEEKDILVETTDVRAQKGRYRIEYTKGSSTGGSLYVSITQLTKSDSGRYGCGMDKRLSQDPYRVFEIIVTDAPTTSKPHSTLPAFSTSIPSASTPTAQSDQQQTSTSGVWLYVGLTLAVMIVLLSLAVLIYCRKRSSKPKEPPVETEYASVIDANRVHEDIREDRQSRSAPVEISSVHTYAKYNKQNGVETTDVYSSVTAASSQNTAEDDSSKLTYSEVNFYNQTLGSSNRALRGDDNNVVYSVMRVEASSHASHAEDDPPVYSTVT